MRLPELLADLEHEHLAGPRSVDITRLTQDSRTAGPGALFVAIAGARMDGHVFVPGVDASAVLVERPVDARDGVAVVRVDNTRRALASVAATLNGHPSRELSLVGFTGTNGKTSASWMLEAIGRSLGLQIGVIGTTGNRIGERDLPGGFTTPMAPEWQGMLREMADAGCQWVAAEVSSIGLAAHRVDATRFEVGVYTNLSQDHLDYHGTMEAYAAAKARLFTELLAPEGTAILNGDDPACDGLELNQRVWRFGLERAGLDLTCRDLEMDLEGSRGLLCTPMGEVPLQLPILGSYNVMNALAAAGAALALGAGLGDVARGLSLLGPIPGRLEPVPNTCGVTVLVDYAHTDDALAKVIDELGQLGTGRRIVVFGCGGDRDRSKRPLMAKAAGRAEFVIATSDNPRSEDPLTVLDDLRTGLPPGALVIPNRAEAIAAALGVARAGDVVLIAGKGHETTQEIAGVFHPFDDRAVAAQVLASMAQEAPQ